jgi:thiamine pyrophosphate-dependent acetolactate synthase large subunit-like protein
MTAPVATTAEVVGRALVAAGVRQVFGVVGSGNFHVTNALVDAGARYVAARHEMGAATMADAFARLTGEPTAVSVHQGCGLTNALTGITEAAKSGTPLIVVTGEATNRRSNFWIDQSAIAEAVGAVAMRVTTPESAQRQATDAVRRAISERRTVLLNLPLDVQAQPAVEVRADPAAVESPTGVSSHPPTAQNPRLVGDLDALAAAVRRAQRPVFVAGRGARSVGARDAVRALADRCGALLATSAVARGLFHGHPFSLDVSGGFASPLAARLIAEADLIVGWGCSLNMWTMRHGTLIGPGATVAQVDVDPAALGAHREVHIPITGDVASVAIEIGERLAGRDSTVPVGAGYRSVALAEEIRERLRWRDVPYDDIGTDQYIDPRTLSIALDEILPPERVVAIDSGNFMGYPAMFLSVPDENGMCFTQAYQSIGLGLATAIGAALAQPGRIPVAALGDGGALMSIAELETVVRLGIGMLIVVYDDAAYGAEVHHFGPDGFRLDTVSFPDTDIAAIGAGFGCDAITVRGVDDLRPVGEWLAGGRVRPLLVDAKIVRSEPSWWLAEAFRGH